MKGPVWHAPQTAIRGEEGGPMIRTAQSCVTAAFVSIYSLLVFREGPDASDRWVAYMGGGGRGIGPYGSRLLDLHTGEEFETTDTDEHHRARKVRPIDLPEELQALWPRNPRSDLLLPAGLDSSKGFPQVDRDKLRQIAATPKQQVAPTLF